MRSALILASMLLVAHCPAAVADALALTFEHAETTRSYRLYRPEGVTGGRPALLLALHGRGASGLRMAELTGFDARAAEHGFVVAYPDALAGRWNYLHGIPGAAAGPDDVGFLLALTDEITRGHDIDPARRYVVGISNGGFMAQRLACSAASGFAGFASVAAGAYAALPAHCARSRPIDALYLHGTADRLLPWRGLGVDDGLGDRQQVTLPIADSLRYWSALNRCAGEIDVRDLVPSGRSPGTRVKVVSSRACAKDARVALYAVIGGGHNWPGVAGAIPAPIAGAVNLDIHASDVIWKFFSRRDAAAH